MINLAAYPGTSRANNVVAVAPLLDNTIKDREVDTNSKMSL
jgi:hypothetical protein